MSFHFYGPGGIPLSMIGHPLLRPVPVMMVWACKFCGGGPFPDADSIEVRTQADADKHKSSCLRREAFEARKARDLAEQRAREAAAEEARKQAAESRKRESALQGGIRGVRDIAF